MARGGARPGAGRPRKLKLPKGIQAVAIEAGQSPLGLMLAIMRDPEIPLDTRVRVAVAAAPFVHPRAEAPSKKEDAREAAGRVGKGRLATPATPPRLIVNNEP